MIRTSYHHGGFVHGELIISEIAPKGTSTVCHGEDWIELYNDGDEAIDLSNRDYILHDDKGPTHEDAFDFSTTSEKLLLAKQYLVLCTKISGMSPWSPAFGIGKKDTISISRLVQQQQELESNVTATLRRGRTSARTSSSITSEAMLQVMDSVGPLPKMSSVLHIPDDYDDSIHLDVTYALDPSTGTFQYTSSPTPGASNRITTSLPSSNDKMVTKLKQRLLKQNAEGTDFFGMDDRGYPTPSDESAFDTVVELHFTMTNEDYQYTLQNASYELYRPFQSALLQTTAGQELARFTSPGRIRPKGQTGLAMGICLATKTIPFQVDMTSQTLFGVETFYLRHHFGDFSYQREWAYNRMLARFGLPHLRARKVLVYMNSNLHGLYTLLEAPTQPYWFARTFPEFDPTNFALYKMKWFSRECGQYTHKELQQAKKRIQQEDEEDTQTQQPYAFERGDHRAPQPVFGFLRPIACADNVIDKFHTVDKIDAVVAYLRHNQDCAEFLLEENLVDRDLGTENWDAVMKDFVRDHWSDKRCDENCHNSKSLADQVNLTIALKTFAFYAVTLGLDSPINNGNNFYMAQTGGGSDTWNMVAYDLNSPRAGIKCNDAICNQRLVHWSIARPTCESLESNQLVGPLLSDPDLHDRYLQYVREFVDSIYSDPDLIDEMIQHAHDIERHVRHDFWSLAGIFYDNQFSLDDVNWNKGEQFPLLPIMQARTRDVRQQLKAIAVQTFPRGPHVGMEGNSNEPWETCADWRASEPDRTMCEQECHYDACHMENWTIPSFCEEGTGTCYHGDYDEQCRGVTDGDQYEGMQNREDGSVAFCRLAKGIPVKTSACPVAETTSYRFDFATNFPSLHNLLDMKRMFLRTAFGWGT